MFSSCALIHVIVICQDKEDDILIGVKSSALRLGDQTKPWLAGFSAVMTSSLLATGYMCEQTLPYYVGVGVVAAHLAYQVSGG